MRSQPRVRELEDVGVEAGLVIITVLYCTVLCCTVLYLGGGVAGTQPEHEGAQVVGGEVHRHPDLTDVT